MPLTQNLKEAPMSILGLILPGRPDTQVIQVIHVPVGILGPVESCWIQEINRMLPTQRELFQELAGWIELSYHAGGKKPLPPPINEKRNTPRCHRVIVTIAAKHQPSPTLPRYGDGIPLGAACCLSWPSQQMPASLRITITNMVVERPPKKWWWWWWWLLLYFIFILNDEIKYNVIQRCNVSCAHENTEQWWPSNKKLVEQHLAPSAISML